jgi:adenosylhomocysteine nucleosidase
MAWELAHALPAEREVTSVSGRRAYLGRVGQHEVVFVSTHFGMVNAAAGTQAIITRFAPRVVLNYGCAGAHRPEVLPGDVVVGTRVVAYDNAREAPDGTASFAGMNYVVGGEARSVPALEADPELLQAARRAAVDLEAWPLELGWPAEVEHRLPRVWFGTVASADRWNRSRASIERIVSEHQSVCEDMEAAAMALVCASAAIPFLSVKDISNNELLRRTQSGTAMVQEFGVQQIARRAAVFTLATVAEISA